MSFLAETKFRFCGACRGNGWCGCHWSIGGLVSDSEVVDSRIGVVDFGEVCVTGGTLQSAGPVGVCAVMADSFELDLRGLGGVYLSGGVTSGSTSASIFVSGSFGARWANLLEVGTV